jgi:hypothetical protein
MGGLAGSIAKIAGIFTTFKIGQKIFEKIKKPLSDLFVGITVDARKAGENSVKAYKAGVESEVQKEKEKEN